ncbi:N-ethylmaleimide reductase [Fodinibius roseus]|uniref:N-ethylmaleimide reductase n=1 Tax=Fodinibius roseus TaxID=1194090 RepID=A0A1M4YY66_9BACT|nr:alkene reductase [Fodinibius roseus]SHF10638.1 N-ethylmaleimide reductase [Fodinibius roseus]
MTSEKLFLPHTVGSYTTENHIVMPPMTRSRAEAGNVPTELMAEYYRQRASAGLIITEGTQISQQGQGYAWTPGIYSSEQIAGWRKVTEAVHEKDGLIFAQLWHVGRVSHTSFQPNGEAPVSSSPLVAEGVKVYVAPEGKGPESKAGKMVQHSKPRALTIPEIQDIIDDFAQAALNAQKAGFDGVEILGAYGYLINQFLDSQVNNRTDRYGGSLHNRLRFLREVTEAVVAILGRNKVGIRLDPLTSLNGSKDDHPKETYLAVIEMLEEIGIAYVHIAEADSDSYEVPPMPASFRESMREAFSGTIICTGLYDKEKAQHALKNNWADMIGFGRPFIANPDLPYRLRYDLPLAEADPDTFYGGGAKGYTDYPTISKVNSKMEA